MLRLKDLIIIFSVICLIFVVPSILLGIYHITYTTSAEECSRLGFVSYSDIDRVLFSKEAKDVIYNAGNKDSKIIYTYPQTADKFTQYYCKDHYLLVIHYNADIVDSKTVDNMYESLYQKLKIPYAFETNNYRKAW